VFASPIICVPVILFSCHTPITAPEGSWMNAIVPWSPTSIGATTTLPPAASAFLTVSAASAVPMYTDHAVGASAIIFGPMPATSLSPIFASAYPPYCGSGLTPTFQPKTLQVEVTRAGCIVARKIDPYRLVRYCSFGSDPPVA
jgi:hypothetical protein